MIWNGAFLTTALAVYIGLFMAVGVPSVVAGAGLLAVIQAATKPERAGRVLSTGFAGMAAFTGLGALGAGALVDPVGLNGLLNSQAVLHVCAGLVVLVGLVWRSGESAEPLEPAAVEHG
jgi:hypothetical protein